MTGLGDHRYDGPFRNDMGSARNTAGPRTPTSTPAGSRCAGSLHGGLTKIRAGSGSPARTFLEPWASTRNASGRAPDVRLAGRSAEP